ncbi:MaoC-like dehydratase domain-containing protein [Mycoplasmopsis synoviae]|uniref:MaoC-like dehydratase domain-containing protein n=1 Tax=Mycoplasmopsis synoviae TaxID=2109 RepID=A0A3B0PA62_MYCSY|nr:MaoC-like dehydratase domain-containing protein [Mycoplasmopsis synoviae]
MLSKRESKSRPDQGIVTVLTKGINQKNEVVISFERTVLVYKRDNNKIESQTNY